MWRKQERSESIDEPRRIRESQPDDAPLNFAISAWEAMAYLYVSEVMVGVRRLMRMLHDAVSKADFHRNALTPGPNGATPMVIFDCLVDGSPYGVLAI